MKTIDTKRIVRDIATIHRNGTITVQMDGDEPVISYTRQEIQRDTATGEVLACKHISQDNVRLSELVLIDPKAADVLQKLDKLVDRRADAEESRKAAEAEAVRVEAEAYAAKMQKQADDARIEAEAATKEKTEVGND